MHMTDNGDDHIGLQAEYGWTVEEFAAHLAETARSLNEPSLEELARAWMDFCAEDWRPCDGVTEVTIHLKRKARLLALADRFIARLGMKVETSRLYKWADEHRRQE